VPAARIHLPVLPAAGRSPAPAVGAAPVPPGERLDLTTLVDRLSRQVRYLRVSLTDRCNLRCTYCRPDEGHSHGPREAVLTFEELERVVAVFARLGVRKLRLTGGEPTVRAGVVELTGRLARIPGIEQVVMTSNGLRLPELAAPLAAAGLVGVNVSLDTLDPARFAQVTGGGQLERVVAGVDAAVAAGLVVKLNAVALRGVNHDEVAALCQFAWARGATMRFIEHMPMSGGALYATAQQVTAAELRAAASALGPLVPAPAGRDPGPARTYWVGGDPARTVGFISAMTEHFCDACNRVRLTASGDLHACLGHDDAVSLRELVRGGAGDDGIVAAIAASLAGKRAGHEFETSGAGGPDKHMIALGG
jgi:cyclic pyranopterin phosphate synthase